MLFMFYVFTVLCVRFYNKYCNCFIVLPERDYVTLEYLPSQFCLSSVCNVRTPYSADGYDSTPSCTLAKSSHPLTVQNFTKIGPGDTHPSEVKRKRSSRIMTLEMSNSKAISRTRCKIRPRVQLQLKCQLLELFRNKSS